MNSKERFDCKKFKLRGKDKQNENWSILANRTKKKKKKWKEIIVSVMELKLRVEK